MSHKIKSVLQHDETDCGAACLSSILQYYGKYVPLRKIRQACGTDTKGTSGLGLVKGAKEYGLSCKGVAAPKKDCIASVPLPAIFHLNRESEHYVVVYKIKNKHIYVSDPAIGLRKLNADEFIQSWSGIFFIIPVQ